jgi:hypothetical protein
MIESFLGVPVTNPFYHLNEMTSMDEEQWQQLVSLIEHRRMLNREIARAAKASQPRSIADSFQPSNVLFILQESLSIGQDAIEKESRQSQQRRWISWVQSGSGDSPAGEMPSLPRTAEGVGQADPVVVVVVPAERSL